VSGDVGGDVSMPSGAMIMRAGLATGVSDFIWACVLSVLVYGSTFAKLWQGVASVPIGKTAMEGGTPMVLAGIALHFVVAFTWSAVLVAIVKFSPFVREAITSMGGAVCVALVYGPFIWVAMSLAVVPALAHRDVPVNTRWWIQLAGHFLFVGLPIVMAMRTLLPDAASRLADS
jgi:hypothetical protein